MTSTAILASKDLVLVFAVANAGLGHLRVTDALYHGLPQNASGLMLGAQADASTWLHRLSSVNPLGRAIQEWMQRGWREDIFTFFYRNFLRKNTTALYKQVNTILDQRVELAKTLLVVSTHFGLSHQMAVIKDRVARERGIRVILVNVVTDDSPQHVWAVGGADLIFVPSTRTRNLLWQYHKTQKMPGARYVVSPYCVSPRLAEILKTEQFRERQLQADCCSLSRVHTAIPISGAAVQLRYFSELIEGLARQSKRFFFHIVSRQSKHTHKFLEEMLNRGDAEVLASDKDRRVVDLYEELYHKQRLLLEITKPSEQAFKALLRPECVGGSILLFSQPVGRQEYDNVAFMRRHDLMPDKQLQVRMWRAAWAGRKLEGRLGQDVAQELRGWRGMRLPETAHDTVTFVLWCLRERVFEKMLDFRGFQKHPELSSDGVRIFWEKVAEYLEAGSRQ